MIIPSKTFVQDDTVFLMSAAEWMHFCSLLAQIEKQEQEMYQRLSQELKTKLIKATSLTQEQEQLTFIVEEFCCLFQQYEKGSLTYEQYIKLVNTLAQFKQRKFNDYIDVLVGAASVGMLDAVLGGALGSAGSPEAALGRSQIVTKMTGIAPRKE